MDKTIKYENVIIALLHEFAEFWRSSRGVKNQVVADKENHIYQLNMFGWQNGKVYVHLVAFHLEIIDGKVWIHQNNTEAMIADELIEKGIAREDIVLGFLHERDRDYAHYAAA
jgi:XisI protein